jgi:hypothetical protein
MSSRSQSRRYVAVRYNTVSSALASEVAVAAGSYRRGSWYVIEHHCVTRNALPPNKWLQLTSQLVTPFAKRRAKGAPSCLAAEPGC